MKKAEALRDLLPGANCGRAAIPAATATPRQWPTKARRSASAPPGGAAVAQATAELLGVKSEGWKPVPVRSAAPAVRSLPPGAGIPRPEFPAAANQFYGGDWLCMYGCLSAMGTVRRCANTAPSRWKTGWRGSIRPLCRGCGLCAKACPKHLIELVPGSAKGVVRCSSHDKGAWCERPAPKAVSAA